MEENKHILQFARPIRLGTWITQYVGPFDSTERAREWYDNACRTWKVALPDVTLHPIVVVSP